MSQFCEDENGALIYNHIPNGSWNSNNGLGLNKISGNGQIGSDINHYHFGNNGYGNSHQEEIENQRGTNSRSRGDTFTLPIKADPLPPQVFAENTFVLFYLQCFSFIILKFIIMNT